MVEFNFEPQGSTVTCMFKGRMDSTASMEANKQISAKLDEISKEVDLKNIKVVFNLKEVDYISSAFMRICLQTVQTITQENFSIKETSPFVMKVFKMTGLDKDLNVS
ncbi:MAG: STAS domain-containing protein [Pseudomonadota bacterium]